MTKKWAPSEWGRKLTRSPNWRLILQGLKLSLKVGGRTYDVNVNEPGSYRVNQGVFWTDVTLYPGLSQIVKVDGLPNARGTDLTTAIGAELVERQIRDDVVFLRDTHQTVLDWLERKTQQEQAAKAGHRWITHEVQAAIEADRPSIDVTAFRARMQKANVHARLGKESAEMKRSLVQWETDHRPFWASLNAALTERELTACKDLFDHAERKPLTDEQARAVICFDNRVQVVASAGSGKTSTMVAKAAYAIHRGFVTPKRIVMLAFNKKAAAELAFAAYQASFFAAAGSLRAATARAGNVIGGGDWSVDRVVPDCVRAFSAGQPVVLRRPAATRPWPDGIRSIPSGWGVRCTTAADGGRPPPRRRAAPPARPAHRCENRGTARTGRARRCRWPPARHPPWLG